MTALILECPSGNQLIPERPCDRPSRTLYAPLPIPLRPLGPPHNSSFCRRAHGQTKPHCDARKSEDSQVLVYGPAFAPFLQFTPSVRLTSPQTNRSGASPPVLATFPTFATPGSSPVTIWVFDHHPRFWNYHGSCSNDASERSPFTQSTRPSPALPVDPPIQRAPTKYPPIRWEREPSCPKARKVHYNNPDSTTCNSRFPCEYIYVTDLGRTRSREHSIDGRAQEGTKECSCPRLRGAGELERASTGRTEAGSIKHHNTPKNWWHCNDGIARAGGDAVCIPYVGTVCTTGFPMAGHQCTPGGRGGYQARNGSAGPEASFKFWRIADTYRTGCRPSAPQKMKEK